MAKAVTLKTASVLAFERKLLNSDAQMHAGCWSDREDPKSWQPILLQEKAIRGTISNRQKTNIQNDPAKLNAELEKPNLQRVDVAALPFEKDTLRVNFSLRVLGNLEKPSACNEPAYEQALVQVVRGYAAKYNFIELSRRYSENLANGRFLWRNRVGAEQIEVRIRHIHRQQMQQEFVFDASSEEYTLRGFQKQPSQNLQKLAKIIEQGLHSDALALLEVQAFVRLGSGQEVFPSQELVLDNTSNNKGKKSKYLYAVEQVAAMHSQKIGNALRTIDTWYPNAQELGPIAVEPFGAVTSRGQAYRQPKDNMDFYSLLDAWILKGHVPDVEQQHFVMATLIRGGVFGEKAE